MVLHRGDSGVAVETHLCSWSAGDEGPQGAAEMPQHCALSDSAMMLVQKGGCGAVMTMLHQCVSDDAAAGGGDAV